MISDVTFPQRIRGAARRMIDKLLPIRSRDSQIIGLIASGIILLILALAGIIVKQTGDVARTEAEKHAERTTNRVAQELSAALGLIDRTLRYAGAELTKADRPSRLEEVGAALVLPSQQLTSLVFLDRDGHHAFAAVNGVATQNVEQADRAYFRVHLDKPSDNTFVGSPITGRLTGRERIPVSRAVRRANGELMGVLFTTIDVESLEHIWSDGGREPVTFALVGGDGTVWLRWPRTAAAGGTPSGPVVWSQYLRDWRLTLLAFLDQQALMQKTAPIQVAVILLALVACILVWWLAVTLSRRARRAARQEEINAVMQETVPVEIMVFDPQRRLVVANRATRAAAGYAGDEILGQTIEELTHNSAAHFRSLDPTRDWDAWAAMRIGRFDRGGVFELPLPNGEWRRAYITSMPDGGRLVVRVDTTEQKKREVLLEASEQRYAELVASLPDVVVTLSPEGVIDYASDAATEVLGRSPVELIRQSLAALVSEANRPRIADTLAHLAREPGLAQTIVCEVLRGDGAPPRLMQIRLKLRDRSQTAATDRIIDGVIRDVHEQQMLASELAGEMERLQSVFQSTGAVIVLLNRAGRVVMANQSALDVLGLPDSKVVGRRYDELKFGGLDPDLAERWRTEVHNERLQPIEFEVSLAGVPSLGGGGEKRIFRFTANPVQDEGRHLRYVVLIGVDDTRRRMAEVRLFDASRLSNLGEVASGIGHEINQPLTVIRFASESLREELEGPEGAALPRPLADFIRLKLDRIIGQTDRAAGIIRDLRAVARKPANDPQPFDLVEATRVGADLLTEQLKLARIEFGVSLPAAPIMVLGEASRLQQVVINLVLNARDAILSRDGSSAAGIPGWSVGRIAIDLAAAPEGGGAVLTIDDDGPGIPPAVLTRLFEPFFTTKPVDKGTGLGLSISYDIVRQMGGEIVAENRTERGARFRVILPPLPTAAGSKAAHAR